MKINIFFYSIGQGIKSIWRNLLFSLASLATMSACIFMFGLFYIVATNFSSIIRDLEENVSVTVFFEPETSSQRITEIGELIQKRDEVKECNYISPEEAWESFKNEYFEGNEKLAEGFRGNPLANSASYEIYTKTVENQSSLVSYLQGLEDVREVKNSEETARTLMDANKLISYVSGGIVLILLIVSAFLISNTVIMGIDVRKDEIMIMKLIGATDFLVRFPFVVEGVIIGLLGAGIPILALYTMYDGIILYISQKFQFIGSMMEFVSTEKIFRLLIPASLLLGVGIGLIASILSVRKHLKEKRKNR